MIYIILLVLIIAINIGICIKVSSNRIFDKLTSFITLINNNNEELAMTYIRRINKLEEMIFYNNIRQKKISDSPKKTYDSDTFSIESLNNNKC
jgi:hypothetical protein